MQKTRTRKTVADVAQFVFSADRGYKGTVRKEQLVAGILVASLCAALGTGCGQASAMDDDSAQAPDAGTPTGSGCASECTGTTGVCELASGTCVQCTSAEAGACGGDAPVCGDDFECRACVADTECTSGACLPDGSCADPNTVVWVSTQASGRGDCSQPGDACASFSQAFALVSDTRAYVHASPGIYRLPSTLVIDKSLTLLGRGATLQTPAEDNVITVNGPPGNRVQLAFAKVENALGVLSRGIHCERGRELTLHAVTLHNNMGGGVVADGCTLRIEASTITSSIGIGVFVRDAPITISKSNVLDNDAGGVVAINAPLTISRTTIARNMLGGVGSTGGAFHITNSFLVRNGIPENSSIGGARLVSALPSVFQFNTVADNKSDRQVRGGGVDCLADNVTGGFNIFYRNQSGAAITERTQHFGLCAGSSSAMALADNPFALSDPDFEHTYRLSARSPRTVRNAATGTNCGVASDIDGQLRPNESGCDLGADEYYASQN